MKTRWIAIVASLMIIAACGDSSNQSNTTQDSTVTMDPNNTTVSPGTPDAAKNGVDDTAALNRTDSLAQDKR